MSVVGKLLSLVDPNEGELRKLRRFVARINECEPEVSSLSEDALRGRTEVLRERLAKGEALDDILAEAFAAVREACKRTLGQRHFDVQLMAAWRSTRATSPR